MNFITIAEYSNLLFEEKVLQTFSNMNLSKHVSCELLDALYRINRYGLNADMLGKRLEKNLSGETGILRIVHNDYILELSICINESSKLVITDCYERKRLEVAGL